MLYADDTVIFGTDAESFQHSLNIFYEYSNLWKLDIDFSKSKIMIFGSRNDDRFQFKLGDNVISICKEFKYLGIIFTRNRSFYTVMKHNIDQAKKAMHVLYKRIRNLNLPIDLQITQLCPLCYMGVKFGGIKILNSLKIYITIS